LAGSRGLAWSRRAGSVTAGARMRDGDQEVALESRLREAQVLARVRAA